MAVEHKHWRTKAGLDTLEQSMRGGGEEKSHFHEVYTTMKAKKSAMKTEIFFLHLIHRYDYLQYL